MDTEKLSSSWRLRAHHKAGGGGVGRPYDLDHAYDFDTYDLDPYDLDNYEHDHNAYIVPPR